MNDLEFTEGYDDEETFIPAAEVLRQLTTAWINEKNAPELLKHVTDLVDAMMDQLAQMDVNLESLRRDDFKLVPHQMEVNRIRYILASYHRCRLEKIETYAAHLVKTDAAKQDESERLMSNGEFQFAQKYLVNMNDHFQSEVLRFMPTLFDDWGTDFDSNISSAMDIAPNINSTVFVRILKSCPSLLVNNEPIELSVGSRHLLPYKDIMKLVKEGAAVLL